MSTILMSTAELLVTTGNNPNIPAGRLNPFVEVAELECRKVLGETLYARIATAIGISATLSSYPTLLALRLEYIVPMMAWRALELAMPHHAGFLTVNGWHTTQGGDFVQGSDRVLNAQTKSSADISKTYQERLIAFLGANSATGEDYPEYQTTTETEERVRKTYRGGVVFRRSRWQRPFGGAGEDDGYCN